MKRFGTVLVANRGEIAVRIIRAAAELGLNTVAVYSDADRDAPHVREADTAVRLGPAPAAQSYLSVPALLGAAERAGADAVHPGYGFLSERSHFAHAVSDAGLIFIGPPADVIEAMGRKDHARAIAIAAGVPVVPSSDATAGADPDAILEQIGLPLLVKAAAGGGGKGMRVVRRREHLSESIAAARREAAAAFGDDTVVFERYVEHGRHVEVQVVADEHGAVVHLFERDCSVQRRHQKVIEEAPAPLLTPELRTVITSAAVALAAEVGYVNTGTVEFLTNGVDAYFLEMNTRLQVEHPVTELVTGIDLVHAQFAVAQGEPLPFSQDDVTIAGHAIEVRVYAEDPYSGFLPQAGTARAVSWTRHARVDAALEAGTRVSTFYDPLLGKIIASGATREAARRAVVSALDDTGIVGLTTNLGYLRELAASSEFTAAEIDTSWLDSHPDRFSRDTPLVAWCLAAWSLASSPATAKSPNSAVGPHPFEAPDGWRAGGPPAAIPVDLADRTDSGDRRLLHVDMNGGHIDSSRLSVSVREVANTSGWLSLEIEGQVQAGLVLTDPHEVQVAYHGQTYAFERPDAFGPHSRGTSSDGAVVAPMPGTVLAVRVEVGDRVESGAVLGVLEAMKMELALKAPFAGQVTEANAVAGGSVELGKRLFVIESATPS